MLDIIVRESSVPVRETPLEEKLTLGSRLASRLGRGEDREEANRGMAGPAEKGTMAVSPPRRIAILAYTI